MKRIKIILFFYLNFVLLFLMISECAVMSLKQNKLVDDFSKLKWRFTMGLKELTRRVENEISAS